ncbi:MAG: T9SS type A sorting domain-containing protein [Janthinobacterium lividum]
MKKQLLSVLLLAGGAVAGSVTTAQAQTPVFVQWTLKRGATDSVQARQPSTGITPAAATFKKFVLSNGLAGTTTAAFAPYSSIGQAFGTAATGAGGSTAITTGPRRGFFEQFGITNSGTAALRVDSLLFTASTANSANGRVALSYSFSNFTTDSVDFVGGKGPTGVLPALNNGTFGTVAIDKPSTTPIILPQYVAGSANSASTFRMGFVSTATGISVPAGGTLNVRLYFRVGSDTEGRYFILRNVTLKSTQAVALASRSALATDLNAYPNPTQNRLSVPHAAASSAAQLVLYSTTGGRVLTQPVATGSLETAVELGSLAKGLYLMEYIDGGQRHTTRVEKN